ncbi:MAG: NIPSNAP family protein [Dehalococcoidia bacterium]|nr:NIPSNAP family protein [Chloroflexota bacterium]
MIYEVRTYSIKPGGVAEFEKRFGEALPHRTKYSPLGAFWHTEIGPLNEVIHVWPYEDLEARTRIREEAAKDPHWPPDAAELELDTRSDIFIPAPFMRPLSPQKLGNIYEMRTYTFRVGTMGEVLKRWGECVPHREKFSPLAACWYSELGELNKFVHIWPYKDLAERDRIRAEAVKDPHWPPPTREFMVKMENKILIPAEFSPLR